jgi:hypothetical protein
VYTRLVMLSSKFDLLKDTQSKAYCRIWVTHWRHKKDALGIFYARGVSVTEAEREFQKFDST